MIGRKAYEVLSKGCDVLLVELLDAETTIAITL